MEADRLKWNSRYDSQESFLGVTPAPFLVREFERIRHMLPGARALDVACGEGRNSVFLACQGLTVCGIDISDVGLDKARRRAAAAGVAVDFRECDLERDWVGGEYDLILNFNFLLRPLIGRELQSLAPGGILLFDTLMAAEGIVHQHNPDYLLQRGELPGLVAGVPGAILLYEECREGDMPTARMIFRKQSSRQPVKT